METKKKKIVDSDIFGVWSKECAEFLKNTLTALSKDIDEVILQGELPETEKQLILQKINPYLEDLLTQVDSITNNACRNAAIHELISYILRDLHLSDKIRYVICVSGFLLTHPLVKDILRKFGFGGFFPNTTKSLGDYKTKNFEFFVIFISPIILEDRAYWPAISHELGHIIERLYGIVETVHREVSMRKAETTKGRYYFHSREYVSDYIASAYFGPVYFDVVYELLHELKIIQHGIGTHPPYNARLHFLKETLPEINSAKTISEKGLKEKYTDIENIGEIITRVRDVLTQIDKERAKSGDQPIFSNRINGESEESSVIARLKEELPSLVHPRVLLNAFWPKRDELLKELQERARKIGKDPGDVSGKIAALIDDSIRLTNMKRTYDFMVKDMARKKEEKEDQVNEDCQGGYAEAERR